MFLRMRCAGPGVASRDDNFVTTFCESVTEQCAGIMSGLAGLATNKVGEAMAPASGYQPSGGKRSGAGATPSLLLLLIALVACGDDSSRAPKRVDTKPQVSGAADLATNMKSDLDSAAPAFGEGVLAELTGDDTAARTAYERVLGAAEVPTDVVARAALHLAQLEVRSGKAGRARDLIARATSLAPSDPTITEGADRVRSQIVAASSAGDWRGPKPGTALPGATPKLVKMWTAAERALVRVHGMRLVKSWDMYIEPAVASQRLAVWEKEDATAAVVRMYRAVAERGGVAQVAAEFRIGTLYHDLAIGLLVEPVVADLRRTLRGVAYAALKKAVTAYKASLAGTNAPEADIWRLAAETHLRRAQDLLGGK